MITSNMFCPQFVNYEIIKSVVHASKNRVFYCTYPFSFSLLSRKHFANASVYNTPYTPFHF